MKGSKKVPVCMPNDVPMPRIVRNTTSGTNPGGTPVLLSVTANTTNNRMKAPMNFPSISRDSLCRDYTLTSSKKQFAAVM
jgi:hypothetical protein